MAKSSNPTMFRNIKLRIRDLYKTFPDRIAAKPDAEEHLKVIPRMTTRIMAEWKWLWNEYAALPGLAKKAKPEDAVKIKKRLEAALIEHKDELAELTVMKVFDASLIADMRWLAEEIEKAPEPKEEESLDLDMALAE